VDGSTVTGSDAVVLVGPTEIVGPRAVDGGLVTAAFESIDDAVALVDDRVVPVDAVWREVMAAAVDPGTCIAVLVCPSWWRSPRVDVVCDAARHVVAEVVLLRRADVLRCDDSTVIVEIAEEFVVVQAPNAAPAVVPRVGDPRIVVDSIDARIDDADVVIDVPRGLDGAMRLGGDLARSLRSRGVAVSVADDHRVLRAAEVGRPRRRRPVGGRLRALPARLAQPRVAALAGAGLVVVALAGAAAGYGADDPAPAASVWLVEGRVAVEVPADWPTERIDSGPGSARMQVLSPLQPHVAILLTQSSGQESLAAAADVLRFALDEQPDGVFVEFTAADRRADKTVITYREIREEHHVDWTVMLDRGVRIAIGCQHAPDRPAPERICDQAIRSARALV
jgi:type VII secretion-associated protein (TIGR03931 family)